MQLKINEIFYSIQGEGLDAGRPCVMVRLAGCNLRCSYCDTEYAFYEGFFMSLDEIIEKITQFNCNMVEITGGEPLYQKNTVFLIKKLLDLGFYTLVETNGSYDLSLIDKRCINIMDVKTPSSKMSEKNLSSNFYELKKNDQLKFVVSDRLDFDFGINLIKDKNLYEKCKNIIFSPVLNVLHPKKLAQWVLESQMDIRMQVQLHKIIWPEDMRGV